MRYFANYAINDYVNHAVNSSYYLQKVAKRSSRYGLRDKTRFRVCKEERDWICE